jgi:integrase
MIPIRCRVPATVLKLELGDQKSGIVISGRGERFLVLAGRTITTRARSGELTERAMLQSDVWRMIRRRAASAGIETGIGCHSFRATGITAYLKNGGKLEIA